MVTECNIQNFVLIQYIENCIDIDEDDLFEVYDISEYYLNEALEIWGQIYWCYSTFG